MEKLDAFDHHLLRLVAADARQTGQVLAAKVGLSPAACLRRLQRLREIGAIEREVAIVSPRFVDRRVKIITRLQVERGGADRMEKLRKKFQHLPEVENFYHVTGDYDVVMVVAFPSMEDYAAFTQAHFYDDLVKGYDSMVVLREYPTHLAANGS